MFTSVHISFPYVKVSFMDLNIFERSKESEAVGQDQKDIPV